MWVREMAADSAGLGVGRPHGVSREAMKAGRVGGGGLGLREVWYLGVVLGGGWCRVWCSGGWRARWKDRLKGTHITIDEEGRGSGAVDRQVER